MFVMVNKGANLKMFVEQRATKTPADLRFHKVVDAEQSLESVGGVFRQNSNLTAHHCADAAPSPHKLHHFLGCVSDV